MPQQKTWEKEYRDPKLVTKGDKPQSDMLRYFKSLKDSGFVLENKNVLDLGSGTGRNSNHLAELGNEVCGLEISETAIKTAQDRAHSLRVSERVKYKKQSIGETFPFSDEYFDLVIDVISSNSLNEIERESYLKETFRVLKQRGKFFVKALCKDGDQNAKKLLKMSPAKEYDTYTIKEMGLTERVFSKEDFINLYSKYFIIKSLEKKTNYSRFDGRIYKRNYWIAYMEKKS